MVKLSFVTAIDFHQAIMSSDCLVTDDIESQCLRQPYLTSTLCC